MECEQVEEMMGEPRAADDLMFESMTSAFFSRVLDNWIQKLGIAFLLLGVGFLFKYSYDHGLIGPPLRVMFGLSVGGTLAAFGWRLRVTRRRLAQVLLGGASATFYLTLFAASQMYGLIPPPLAFGGMMAVTMGTFVVATAERDAVLANIAAIGGFVTPFVLDTPALFPTPFEDLGTLIYMCVVLAGTAAIYFYRGWQSVLLTSVVFMWGYLTLAMADASTVAESAAVQAAILVTFVATAVLPVLRDVLHGAPDDDRTHVSLAPILTLLVPAIALVLSRLLWDFPDVGWGLIGGMLAASYAMLTMHLRQHGQGKLASMHMFVAVGLTTLALSDFLSGAWLMTGLFIQAVALCWFDHAERDHRRDIAWGWGSLGILGRLMISVLLVGSVATFAQSPDGLAFVGAQGVQMLMASVALVAISRFHDEEAVRPGLQWAAHLFFLGTVLHQTSAMVHGDLIATACWGAYSLVLLATGLAGQRLAHQWMGLVALFLAAGKLILVDMQGAETLWRVALFVCFGVALLVLSYLAPRWRVEMAV